MKPDVTKTNSQLIDEVKELQNRIAELEQAASAQKKLEEAVQVSETRYRRLFETAEDGVLILNAETGQIDDVNPYLIKMLGYSREEFIGKKLWEIGVFKNWEISRTAFAELQKKEYIRYEDLPLEAKDGHRIEVEFVSNIYLVDHKKVIQCNIRDITDRKKAEAAMQVSETRYRRLFETAEDGVLILNAETGQIDDVNPYLIKMLGYSREEFIGKKLWEIGVFKNWEISRTAFAELQKKEYIRYEDLPLEAKDGHQIEVEFVSNVYLVDHKKVIQCNIRENTKHSLADKDLSFKTALLEAQSETTIDGILAVNNEGKIILYNNRFTEIWNIPPQLLLDIKDDAPVLQHVLTQLKDPQEFLKKVKYLYAQRDEKSRDEIELANGNTLDRYSSPLIDSKGTYYGRIWYFRDITERKKGEENLKESNLKLRQTLEETVNSLASAVETRDPYTAGHERRDALLACAIAKEMGLTEDQIEGLRIASLIHDIGKMAVPAEILSKPTKLTNIEFALIKVHPEVGYTILKDIEFPWPIAQIVYQHHERIDGSGYPRGLKGDEIILEARILMVADVVEAMSSHRPYRPALGLIPALDEIKKNKGILYDPQAVDACLRVFQEKGFKFD